MITFLDEIPSNALHQSSYLSKWLTPVPPQELGGEEATLTIIGQALTPYIVKQVIEAFMNRLTVRGVYLHPLHNQFGDGVVVIKGDLCEMDNNSVAELIESLSEQYYIDLGLQTNQPELNRSGLLVMDMDSTVIAMECIDEIAKLADVGEQVAQVTERAMRGEIDFNDSLIHRVACLKGIPVRQLQQIRDRIPLMPGVQLLINTLKQHGWKIAIASGGFTYFANHLKERLELDEAVSNTLVEHDGVLSGEVSGEIVNAQVKARTVNELAQRWDIPGHQTVAMGDGANDLVMMAQSALGVACHGKPVVNQQADVAIRRGSLHYLLYFLG